MRYLTLGPLDFISAFLVNLLKVKPSRTLTRGIKTIMGLVTKRVET